MVCKMEYNINLKTVREQRIERLSDKFCGKDSAGNEMAFTNYYLTVNGEPYFGVLGECHYSRVHESQWEDTVIKMKMGGINIIATYCFWNHHEEVEGKFRFDGNRNVRKFVEICQKHGMYVIIRIGPYAHGEVRNGGIPDWLYGKPFEVRSLNDGWLSCTRQLYRQYAKQLEGLWYKDGGPIIGAQIENEYMHSSSPWEMTTGVANEWVLGGADGAEYMLALKKIAQEEGIITPFYTCTGWGGAAAVPDELLTLWGGYAFWPWMFYDYRGEHPATPEYIYRDNHNNSVPKTYNFEPAYKPESFPYACCEMGGGMACFYYYRFQLPYESVDAMANIKIASGCNFVGYYMYRGGSNPKGEKTLYLNECQCPKISYDYQAAIGEFGQLRPSYFRLKALHYFVRNFEKTLCDMVTVLPEGSQEIDPKDQDTLRYAVRTDGESGFLFLNNYQDHCTCKDKKDETVILQLKKGELRISGISLAAEEEAVLPFEMNVEGARLLYARVQPLSVIRRENRVTYFFFTPRGMKPEYVWESDSAAPEEAGENCQMQKEGNLLRIVVPDDRMSSYVIKTSLRKVEIVTLTREQSLQFYEVDKDGVKTAVLASSPLLFDGEKLELESPADGTETSVLLMYPPGRLEVKTEGKASESPMHTGIFKGVRIIWDEALIAKESLEIKRCGPSRYTFKIPQDYSEYKDALIQIMYEGDIGHVFINGELVSDNFCNGAVWEIGLKEVWNPSMGDEITIYITPKKKEAGVDVSSTMAGRLEQLKNAVSELKGVTVQPVGSIEIKLK